MNDTTTLLFQPKQNAFEWGSLFTDMILNVNLAAFDSRVVSLRVLCVCIAVTDVVYKFLDSDSSYWYHDYLEYRICLIHRTLTSDKHVIDLNATEITEVYKYLSQKLVTVNYYAWICLVPKIILYYKISMCVCVCLSVCVSVCPL